MDEYELDKKLIDIEPVLWSIARGYFPCYADQQDAVQECMFKAWRSRERLKSPDSFEAWTVRIMKNVCASMCRKCIHYVELSEETIVTDGDPFHRLIEMDALYSALDDLPPKGRDCVRGHYLEGHSFKELSETYGISIGTVQSRIYRSLKRMALMVG